MGQRWIRASMKKGTLWILMIYFIGGTGGQTLFFFWKEKTLSLKDVLRLQDWVLGCILLVTYQHEGPNSSLSYTDAALLKSLRLHQCNLEDSLTQWIKSLEMKCTCHSHYLQFKLQLLNSLWICLRGSDPASTEVNSKTLFECCVISTDHSLQIL